MALPETMVYVYPFCPVTCLSGLYALTISISDSRLAVTAMTDATATATAAAARDPPTKAPADAMPVLK